MRMAKHILSRLAVWLLTIWVGITVVFFVQRMMPSDPVDAMISKIVGQGATMTPEEIDIMRKSLELQYGLDGTIIEQYASMLKRLVKFDFGISMSNYPTPVNEIVAQALPYTAVLLLVTTVLSWIVGNIIGLLAGFKKDKWYAKTLETISMCIYPTPYFIVALIIMVFLAYVYPVFPLVPNFGKLTFSWEGIKFALYNSFMPALSLMLVGTGWWIISMKSLASNVAEEDYVNYGRLKGLSEATIGFRYVFRNSILTQVTALALHIGGAFSGSLMCEVTFSYPGVGMLIQRGINSADYNLLTGTIFVSIFAVATATLVVDLIYPLIDPRIRNN